jgi:transposase
MKLAWMRLLALALTTLSMLGPCALLAGEAGSAVLDRESRKAVRPPVPSAWMRVAETKRLRHLNFFQHECYLEVRMPRVRLPDGGVRLVEPDWAGKLAGFTLLFEALILTLCRERPFAAVARLVNLSWHRVAAICERYVDLALAEADFSAVARLAVDETSRAK